jgi:hypothetical protein
MEDVTVSEPRKAIVVDVVFRIATILLLACAVVLLFRLSSAVEQLNARASAEMRAEHAVRAAITYEEAGRIKEAYGVVAELQDEMPENPLLRAVLDRLEANVRRARPPDSR